tara:strand:- start:1492 stop:2718 length:1227 start_codon:yes stop_codon:yes gene_type:complete
MGLPGTGSTNQTLTFSAAKKLAGKAHTSNLKEIYNETIPSNVQISTGLIFGETPPTSVTTTSLYGLFPVSDPTVEYVEFYVQSIGGTSYDANTGSFGDVGFGGGDEAQTSGPHGYQLVLTSSYEASSSNPNVGTGFFVDDQVVHQSNGGLQLVNPLFGPQTGNNYGLTIYTAHPDDGGLQIPTTSPIDWLVDYQNGIIFIQDYISTAVPTYARGFIYIGKSAETMISEASSSSGGGGSGDVDGPGASNDNAVARFNGTTGKIIQNTSQVRINDSGFISSSAGGHFVQALTGLSFTSSGSISAKTTVSGAGAGSFGSITVANSTVISNNGSITGSGLATFSNTTIAQGAGYKAAVIVSSSAITTAADAGAIPRMVLQGTNGGGYLSDFLISVSGGLLRVEELTHGTWSV